MQALRSRKSCYVEWLVDPAQRCRQTGSRTAQNNFREKASSVKQNLPREGVCVSLNGGDSSSDGADSGKHRRCFPRSPEATVCSTGSGRPARSPRDRLWFALRNLASIRTLAEPARPARCLWGFFSEKLVLRSESRPSSPRPSYSPQSPEHGLADSRAALVHAACSIRHRLAARRSRPI